jgi:hypothetical protein
MGVEKLNILGAYLALFIFTSSILIFIFRLLNQENLEYWTGIAFVLTAIPLCYLLFTSLNTQRSSLYIIQLALMLGFVILELFVDYILKLEFRSVKWMAITYTVFFFSSTGGMIGVASEAGKGWSISAIILFLIMFALAFVQRAKTGI